MLTKALIQLYSAGLLSSPSHSAFRNCFASQTVTDFKVTTQLLSEWNACIQTLEGHSDSVLSVVFSPDGSRVASGSWDKTVRVWGIQTGQCQHTHEGHSREVYSVVFSPDGSRVASGSWDKTVRVWDIANSTEILCYDTGTYDPKIEFSDDGAKIVVNCDSVSIPFKHHYSALWPNHLSMIYIYLSTSLELMTTGSLHLLRESYGFLQNIAPNDGQLEATRSS